MSTILAVANYDMKPLPPLLPLCYSLAVAMAINETGARRHEQSPANLTSPLIVSSAAWDLRLQRTLKLYMGGRNSTELPGFFVKQLEEIKEKGHLPRFPASFNASQRQGPRQSNRPPPTHENKVGHQQEGHQPGSGSESGPETGPEPGEASLQQTDTNTAPETKKDE